MPDNQEFETGLESTHELARLLSHRDDQNPDWQDKLDVAFLHSEFDHNHQQPYMIGPDGKRYFAFRLPNAGTIAAVIPTRELDQLIEFGEPLAWVGLS